MTHPAADRAFRLGPDVRPVHYAAFLSVDLAGRAFRGTLSLELRLAAPVDELVLHAAGLAISRAVLHAGGRALEARVECFEAGEAAVLRLPGTVGAGPATLELGWTGAFCDGLRGLYLAGPELCATQFEAAPWS